MTTWRNNTRINIDKDNLYDLYFNKKLSKKEICKLLGCTEKVIDKRFKIWGWKFRDSGKMVGKFMKNKSTILPHLENIKKLYIEEKKTCAEIGKLYKVTECAISRLLKKNSVNIRNLADAQVHSIVIDKKELMNMYLNKKMSCEDISKETNISCETIRRNLINSDIDRRTRYDSLIKFDLKKLDEILKYHNMIRVTKLNSLNDLNNRREKIMVKCLKDGLEWKASVHNLLQGMGCPFCSFKSEKYTYEILLEILSNVKIEPHYKLGNYVGEDNKFHNMYIDYYFKIGDKEFVVEYNGKQHYELVKWSKNNKINEEKFKYQIFRDGKVKEYCELNKIQLIEIDGRHIAKKEEIKQFIIPKLKEMGVLC